MEKILVVDDDQSVLKVIKMRLEAGDYKAEASTDSKKAIEMARHEIFDLALVDLRLGSHNGIELMEELHQTNPEMPIIIFTAYGTIENAVEAMRRGAYSYLTKPFDYNDLLTEIKDCLGKSKLSKEIKSLRDQVKQRYGFEHIVYKSEKMQKVLEQVTHAGAVDSNVYIEGESGTGKELIAKTLHVASARKDHPFVAINCAAIPETLLEGELFGYERGAFTGAARGRKGLFALAHTGTFFLDEISEMPLSMQVKLLRALEEKEFYPLGGDRPVKVDVRIIAATNKNLEEETRKGTFRKDLYYRIHVIPIRLPPLRERKEEIPYLARFFLEKNAKKMNKQIKEFSAAALQKLLLHSWPGNVRELENTVECAVALATQDTITDDLLLNFRQAGPAGPNSFKSAKENFERDYLIQLIELTRGNVSQAAKLAGKYRADLYELLKKYEINPSDFRESRGVTNF
ncbi:Transcriptional regulatory protein QseF [uncultured Desulfobacterium sp.]|uniref:Transcriptional regulatory protein QseF n=1 Tax=uncultured Desulfobacterium sp. TaxID=201089 RepID=A0A445N3L8_9BACT|nr:Transcriptional regulatory protein QseF [uncultured Desulfobacterium sp.]